jgi:hypothetical protein
MIPKRLQSRLKTIKATPLKDRAQAKTFSRREISAVSMQEEEGNEKFDTFFDYEDDLAELRPSSEQYTEMINAEPYIMLEDADLKTPSDPVVMEEDSEVLKSNLKTSSNSEAKSITPFNFIQCEFEKKDGNRCKRQAPKNSTLCSSHRKYLEKQKNR